MKRRVVVTGMGAVTSLSCKIEDLWRRLQGESGVSAIGRFDTSRISAPALAERSVIGPPTATSKPKDAKRLDRFTQFAVVSAIDAVRDAGLDFAKEDVRPLRCADRNGDRWPGGIGTPAQPPSGQRPR